MLPVRDGKKEVPKIFGLLPVGDLRPSVGLAVAPHDAKQLRHFDLPMCKSKQCMK